ncbi:hypothetical protein KJ762_14890 [bacterium]|nr:hypothetical protein [bacterium]MBU1065111.1 hypothetical protein [bacterium]MBU1635775.1 hypothetical protein [bacterium]MBU1873693.1 hypothetical protein [bacterium]
MIKSEWRFWIIIKTIDVHLNKDAEFFIQDLSDDFISVSGGEIDKPDKEDVRNMFRNYFNTTQFSEYHDLQKPIIGFSNDGSPAWSIIQVKVAGMQVTGGLERDLDFTAAWITLYERQEEKWVRIAEVSNFK